LDTVEGAIAREGGGMLTEETTGARVGEGVVPGAAASPMLFMEAEGCSRLERSLNEVDSRKAPKPSSIASTT
jgi:hypothetical protein